MYKQQHVDNANCDFKIAIIISKYYFFIIIKTKTTCVSVLFTFKQYMLFMFITLDNNIKYYISLKCIWNFNKCVDFLTIQISQCKCYDIERYILFVIKHIQTNS